MIRELLRIIAAASLTVAFVWLFLALLLSLGGEA